MHKFRLFSFVFVAAFTVFVFSGVAYAANTGISSHVSSDSSVLVNRASDSDASRKGDAVNNALSVEGDSPVISIERGTVLVQSLYEADSLAGESIAEDPLMAPSRSSNNFGFYIDVSSSIGSRLYVPSDYREDSFYVDSSNLLHGCRSSSFICYIGNYSVRFPAYSAPQYRLTSGTSYTWTDLDIEFDSSPNVSIVGARYNFFSDRFQTLLLVVIGGLVVCLCMKH